jgi:hypothetical protein
MNNRWGGMALSLPSVAAVYVCPSDNGRISRCLGTLWRLISSRLVVGSGICRILFRRDSTIYIASDRLLSVQCVLPETRLLWLDWCQSLSICTLKVCKLSRPVQVVLLLLLLLLWRVEKLLGLLLSMASSARSPRFLHPRGRMSLGINGSPAGCHMVWLCTVLRVRRRRCINGIVVYLPFLGWRLCIRRRCVCHLAAYSVGARPWYW